MRTLALAVAISAGIFAVLAGVGLSIQWIGQTWGKDAAYLVVMFLLLTFTCYTAIRIHRGD